MSTRMPTYCNTTTDLWEVDPNFEVHDNKREIQGWESLGSSLYSADDVGYIDTLFADGEDLGSAEDALVDVDANGEWFYDSTTDKVTYYNDTTSPLTITMEAGEDYDTYVTRMTQRASEVVRSYINRSIPKRSGTGQQTADSRDYDWVITHSTAIIAVSLMMRSRSAAQLLRKDAMNPEWDEGGGSPGWLDMVKSGQIKLWNEIGIAEKEGDVRAVALDATTTGTIIDTKVGSGGISTEWDLIKIKIGTGGTVDETANTTVTFSSYITDGDTIKNTVVQNDQYVELGYVHVGWNLYIRFGPGVYVADDEWEIEVSSLPEEHGRIGSIDLVVG